MMGRTAIDPLDGSGADPLLSPPILLYRVVTDANSNTTSDAYHSRNRLTTITEASGVRGVGVIGSGHGGWRLGPRSAAEHFPLDHPDGTGLGVGARVPSICGPPASLRGGLRRGHPLGAGRLPGYRPIPSPDLDSACRPPGPVVLDADRGQPVVSRPLDRRDPRDDIGRPDP